MRVLGIDPGLRLTGYACIDASPSSQPKLIEAGVFRLTTTSTVADRLVELHEDLASAIARLSPDLGAVEKLFAHYKHPNTAITMGHARGIVLYCFRAASLPISELTATEVKKALTDKGHASKEQMQRAAQAVFMLPEPPSPPDVADAMAIALCAANRAHADTLTQA